MHFSCRTKINIITKSCYCALLTTHQSRHYGQDAAVENAEITKLDVFFINLLFHLQNSHRLFSKNIQITWVILTDVRDRLLFQLFEKNKF